VMRGSRGRRQRSRRTRSIERRRPVEWQRRSIARGEWGCAGERPRARAAATAARQHNARRRPGARNGRTRGGALPALPEVPYRHSHGHTRHGKAWGRSAHRGSNHRSRNRSSRLSTGTESRRKRRQTPPHNRVGRAGCPESRPQSSRHEASPMSHSPSDLSRIVEVYSDWPSKTRASAAQRTYFQSNLAYLESLLQLKSAHVQIEGLLLSGSLNGSSEPRGRR